MRRKEFAVEESQDVEQFLGEMSFGFYPRRGLIFRPLRR